MLLPPAAVLNRELRPLDQEGRSRQHRARCEIWRKQLDDYVQPPLDDAVRAELDEFVVRRRAELGD